MEISSQTSVLASLVAWVSHHLPILVSRSQMTWIAYVRCTMRICKQKCGSQSSTHAAATEQMGQMSPKRRSMKHLDDRGMPGT